MTIKWEVLANSTSETYFVEYNDSTDKLSSLSCGNDSDPKIVKIQDGVYTKVLSNLSSSTTYYFRVISNSRFGCTASNVYNATTKQCELHQLYMYCMNYYLIPHHSIVDCSKLCGRKYHAKLQFFRTWQLHVDEL